MESQGIGNLLLFGQMVGKTSQSIITMSAMDQIMELESLVSLKEVHIGVTMEWIQQIQQMLIF